MGISEFQVPKPLEQCVQLRGPMGEPSRRMGRGGSSSRPTTIDNRCYGNYTGKETPLRENRVSQFSMEDLEALGREIEEELARSVSNRPGGDCREGYRGLKPDPNGTNRNGDCRVWDCGLKPVPRQSKNKRSCREGDSSRVYSPQNVHSGQVQTLCDHDPHSLHRWLYRRSSGGSGGRTRELERRTCLTRLLVLLRARQENKNCAAKFCFLCIILFDVLLSYILIVQNLDLSRVLSPIDKTLDLSRV
jgi:hypothetical protein